MRSASLEVARFVKFHRQQGSRRRQPPRFASTRVKRHSFHQDPDTKNYSLSFRFPELGIKVQQQFDITIIAHPHLQHLMSITGESANFAICDGGVVVVPDLICQTEKYLHDMDYEVQICYD